MVVHGDFRRGLMTSFSLFGDKLNEELIFHSKVRSAVGFFLITQHIYNSNIKVNVFHSRGNFR